jgi:2-desacetyl-2-hydroxyethyl bacteriochlorophyllide A dehydrogenase
MDGHMKRTAVTLQAPFHVEVCHEPLPPPAADEVAVHTRLSAVSAGTELLFYRGRAPKDLPLDTGLSSLSGPPGYPLRYGYAAVGEVVATGAEVPGHFMGRRVFCFHPHASQFSVKPMDTVPIPADIDDSDALFLANMETAVTLMLDGGPMIGETVAVFGQGVVGLLAAALLARHPVRHLLTVDPIPRRRKASLDMGAHAAFDSAEMEVLKPQLASSTAGSMADLVYELSSDPSALNAAIDLAGFGARIVIGSWYGTVPTVVNLGGRFHRSRIRVTASQVSTLPADFAARWDRARRQEIAWEMIRHIRPSRLITHEMPVERAAGAYDLLDREPEEVLQIVFTYDG